MYSKYVRDLFLKLRVPYTPLPAICLIVLLAITWLTADSGRDTNAPQLYVLGNELVNADGQQVVLYGVDCSGTEYDCVQALGIFSGSSDQVSIKAMKSWGVNVVRVPLNEACWNAEPYVDPAYAGKNYQVAIEAHVKLLNADGVVAILDLHWSDSLYTGPSSGCSSAEALCQKPMPDLAGSVPFWSSAVAAGAVVASYQTLPDVWLVDTLARFLARPFHRVMEPSASPPSVTIEVN